MNCSYPWKVSAVLSPRRVMLDSIQHQIEGEYSHAEYGPPTHRHLFPQLHPLQQRDFQSDLGVFSLLQFLFCPLQKKGTLNPVLCSEETTMGSNRLQRR